ncbi:MAG TPA: hypothetical protein VFF14_01515, partial [Candidatus Deferrimicrobium sp.]|nr:hypothetical protein [Candidatus Deferrimicrobium sp.]
LTGLLGILFSNLSGILIDLFNPKLHWDNEQQAVKRNINLMISMVISIIVGVLTVFAVIKLKLTVGLAAGIFLAAFGILDILLYLYLMKKGAALFSQIES